MQHLVTNPGEQPADFAVLAEDPTTVDPMALKDVPVLGTVQSGRPFLL